MEIREGSYTTGKGQKAIIEYELDKYVIYVFQGSISEFDILIKYKQDGKRVRTPRHIHWVIDALMKMQANEELTKEFMRDVKRCWDECEPLKSNDFCTLKALIENGEREIDLSKYSALNGYGEYGVEFLYVLMELLTAQEKTNRADAYMFRNVLDELLKEDIDIFSIVSTAGYNGRN